MRLLTFFLFAVSQFIHARPVAQTITLSGSNIPIQVVFAAIKQQTGYVILYDPDLFPGNKTVSLTVKALPIPNLLEMVLKDQPLAYNIQSKTIFIFRKPSPVVSFEPPDLLSFLQITGVVRNADSEPLIGASIRIKGSSKGVLSDEKGNFSINAESGQVLLVSYTGYESKEILIGTNKELAIQLKRQISSLDETVVIAYGTTTQRLNTGSVSKVSSEQISRQPVSNPLAALQGQVPGLTMYQESGLPGADVNINIRGDNSISQGSTPLFVIDGVPMASANGYTQGWYNNVSGSVFSSLNPDIIESIEVLKDADATAIYGSRGANGVILITTKKGAAGKSTIDLKWNSGFSMKAFTPKMLNTQQYLDLRKEAFKNDGVTPNATNAPDLLVWDQEKYTDWEKEITGQTATTNDALMNITGGTKTMQYLLGAGYHQESTILAQTEGFRRGNLHLNLSHQSLDDRFKVSFTGDYVSGSNKLPSGASIILNELRIIPPNAPDAFDEEGNLVWTAGFSNPYALLLRTNHNKTQTISGNVLISYKLAKGLLVKLNAGSNNTQDRIENRTPRASLRPSSSSNAVSSVVINEARSWIAEPQITYNGQKGALKVDALIGGSWQNQYMRTETIQGVGFANDNLLNNVSSAASINFSNAYSRYRYHAFFSRVGLNWENKYLINLSGRRDGSSRFGPGKRFSDFGAVGAAWIFTEEKFIGSPSWLTFGKLRMSYGITGNDQIGDYRYLDTWSKGTLGNFLGQSVMVPDQLFNPNYVWEQNQKMDIAIELGLWDNKLFASVNYYLNKSGNQLTSLSLPHQTGFASLTVNQDATVQNSGIEVILRGTIMEKAAFTWTSDFNLSVPRNKLLAYPGIENTSRRFSNVVGKPLSSSYGYKYTGVDPATGVYTFLDVNKDGKLSNPEDYVFRDITAKGVVYNGGITNSFRYKDLELDVFFNYIHQYKIYAHLSTYFRPGAMENMPAVVLERIWRQPGDRTDLQKATASTSSDAYRAKSTMSSSDGSYAKSSYLRLRNLAAAYNLPQSILQKLHLQRLRVFSTVQNLFTFSANKGNDPEVERAYNLSNIKTITAGVQLTF